MNGEREAAVKALRDAADEFEVDMAKAWGGERGWYTTGTHVAQLAAAVLREMATDLAESEATP